MDEKFAKLFDDVMDVRGAGGDGIPFEDRCEAFSEAVREYVLGLGKFEIEQLQRDAEQRFSASISLGRVHDTVVALVGAGGLGNWIWRVLLGMGFMRLHIFDDDKVGVENIGPQAHRMIDIGLPKVEAIRREALAFRGVEIFAHDMRVEGLGDIVREVGRMPDVLIGATDSARFRNAIINGFAENLDYRRLPLFLDLRMSLGDWNAFAFPVMGVDENEGFAGVDSREEGEQYPEDMWYEKYRRVAVFDDDDAVREPCTARAITYTGANVASYVGAFLHWWVNGGEGKCREEEFLYDKFFKDERDGAEFNWMYRNSSKEFSPETVTVRQKENSERANMFLGLRNAVKVRMEREWPGMFSSVLGSGEDLNDTTDTLLTEAYVDVNGDVGLFQAYTAHDVGRVLAINVNLDKGTALLASRGCQPEEDVYAAANELSATVSGGRLHVVYLPHTSVISALLERGSGANFLEAQDGSRPFVASVMGMGDGSDTLVTVRYTPDGFDESTGSARYKVDLFTDGERFEKVPLVKLSELAKKVDGCGEVFMTGFAKLNGEERDFMRFHSVTGNGSNFDLFNEGGIRPDDLVAALVDGAGASASVRLSGVEDGTMVRVDGFEGVFEKRSEANRPYLVQYGEVVSVPADMRVVVVSGE